MNRWICNERVSGKGNVSLFIFPCSGGTASSYHKWHEYLNEEIDRYPVQYPMREKRAYYEAHPEVVHKIIREGSERARSEAQKVLKEVRRLINMY